MDSGATLAVLQVSPVTPGIGSEQLVDVWPALIRLGWFLVSFLAVALVGWLVIEPLISRTVRRRNRRNPTIQEAITRYVRVVVLLVAAIVGAATAGYVTSLTNSALVVAAATLAVGVAAQSVIGSMVSGLVLVMDPEFNVGDYIEWEDRSGTVQSITLRVTRVLTPNGELVTVPNTNLTSQPVTRPYGRGRYRVVEHIGLAYDESVDDAATQLTAAAGDIDSILRLPPPEAFVDEFGSDAVVMRVHYWIEDPRRRDVFEIRSAYARAVKDRFDEAGLTISPASKRELQGRIVVDEPP